MSQENIEKKNFKVEHFINIPDVCLEVGKGFFLHEEVSDGIYNLNYNGLPADDHYALIFKDNLCDWFRVEDAYWAMQKNIAGIQRVICGGFIKLNKQDKNKTFAIVIEKIRGESLRKRFKYKAQYNKILSIFTEVFQILKTLHENKIYHGNVNLDNIYITDDGSLKLTEAFIYPCGYKQVCPYETIERNTVLAFCKAQYNGYFDFYALGVTIFLLLSKVNEDVLAERLISGEVQNIFAYFSSIYPITGVLGKIIELLLSIRSESYSETLMEIEGILHGNIVQDRIYSDNEKITYNHAEYTCKSFAIFLHKNWDNVGKIVNSSNFDISIGKTNNIKKIASYILKNTLNKKLLDIYTTCILAIIESDSTIRFRDFSVCFDSISNLLVSKNTDMIEEVIDSLKLNMLGLFHRFGIIKLSKNLLNLQTETMSDQIIFSLQRLLFEITKKWYFRFQDGVCCINLQQIFFHIENSENIYQIVHDNDLISYISYRISLNEVPHIFGGFCKYTDELMRWLVIAKARRIEGKPVMTKSSIVFVDIIKDILQKSKIQKYELDHILKTVELLSQVGSLEELVEGINKEANNAHIEYQKKLKALSILKQKYELSKEELKDSGTNAIKLVSMVSCVICAVAILIVI